MVEGLRQDVHLLGRVAGLVDSGMQVAGVDASDDLRYAAQGRREARSDQIGGEKCAHEHEDAGENECTRDAVLGASHLRERLPHADDHRDPAGKRELLGEQSQLADVWLAQLRVPERGA